MYQIKLTNFEGPLDLLYQLIEVKKLDITEISLAKVADQFLEYVQKNPPADLATLADFMVTAGRLALIKSRALLPFLEPTTDEEESTANLKEQLAEYRHYRQLAGEIKKLYQEENRLYARSYLAGWGPIFYFPPKLTAQVLAQALGNLIETITLPGKIPQARAVDIVPLEQKVKELEKELSRRTSLNFSEVILSNDAAEKVVVLLSVLELVNQHKVAAHQPKNFADIKLIWQGQTV